MKAKAKTHDTQNKKQLKKIAAAGIRVILAALICMTVLLPTTACKKVDPDSKLPTTNIAPAPLPAQKEPNDSGEPVTYTVNGTISSDMVVQRNAYFNVFGRSDNPGAVIYGEFMGEKRYGIVAEDGSWTIRFSSHEAVNEGQTLVIYPKNGERTEFEDILVGDVWVISGQSNAELMYMSTASTTPEYAKEINKNDLIRIYSQSRQSVMDAYTDGLDVTIPQEDVVSPNTKWAKTTTQTVLSFSAIGYYFGKELSKTIDVPLGLIMAASGGSTLHELMPGDVAAELGFTTGASVPVSGFYNTLLYPFTRNKITGMIFYQGESESAGGQYLRYADNLKRTVSGYRHAWGLCFPFINVQLSTHGSEADYYWPELPYIRAAQFDAYRSMLNSYIVTAMDQGYRAGDPDWAHPLYKLELGKRAAKIAAYVVYGQGDAAHSLAPEPDKITWNSDNSIVITFKNVGDGITLLEGDKIAGLYALDEYGDKMYSEIEQIDGSTVKIVLTREPSAVGYGIRQDGLPASANIASSDGIPMPAFIIKK
jgi:sialate O-acetylesterase